MNSMSTLAYAPIKLNFMHQYDNIDTNININNSVVYTSTINYSSGFLQTLILIFF